MSTPSFDHSAIFWREGTYHMYLTVEWEDKWMEWDMRAFLGEAKRDLRQLSLWGHAAYINFPDGALPADYSEWAYWGGNREELRRIKKIWDEDNFFRSQQGVRLPPPTPPPSIQVERGDDEPGHRGDNLEELHRTLEIRERDDLPQSEQGIRVSSGIPGIGSFSQSGPSDWADDEDFTDSLASKHWEVYETKDIVGQVGGLRGLADLGLWSGF